MLNFKSETFAFISAVMPGSNLFNAWVCFHLANLYHVIDCLSIREKFFWLILIILASLLYRRKKKIDQCLLSSLVSEAKKNLVSKNFAEEIYERITATYLPSPESILMSLFASFLLLALGTILSRMFGIFSPWMPMALLSRIFGATDQHVFSDFIATEIGISALLFPIVIFIVELGSDKDDGVLKKSEILLRGTFLFPVTMLTIFQLAELAVFHKSSYGFIFVLASSLVFVFVFYKTVKLILDEGEMRTIGLKLVSDKVKKAVDYSVRKRISGNIIVQQLEAIGVTPTIISDEKHLCLYNTQGRFVTEIDFCLLERMVKLINDQLNLDLKPSEEIKDSKTTNETKNVFFAIGFSGVMGGSSECLLAINRKSLNRDVNLLKELRKIAEKAITVGDKEDEEERFTSEMTRLKDFMLESIAEGKTGAIENGARDYTHIMESFLTSFARYKGEIHSSEQAFQELHRIGGGWSIVDVVARNISEFNMKALKSNDLDIVGWIAALPISIATKALKFKDHYLFQRFIPFPILLYKYVLNNPDTPLKEYLIDRSWRHLRELADFSVERNLREKSTDVYSTNNYTDFGLEVLVPFQDLMKLAIDHRDLSSLKLFYSKLIDRFKNYTPSLDSNSVEWIDLALRNVSAESEEAIALRQARVIQAIKEESEAKIKERKKVIIFGLMQWTLRSFEKTWDDPVLKDMLAVLIGNLSGSSVMELTSAFLKSMETEDSERLGWSWWEIDTRTEGTVRRMDTSDYLQKVYTLTLLSAFKGNNTIEKFPASRRLVDFVQGNQSKVRAFLNEIEAHPQRWQWLLPSDFLKRIPPLLQTFDETEKIVKIIEDKEISQAKISGIKMDEFKRDFFQDFERHASMFTIAKNADILRIELDTSGPKEITSWGYNQLFSKEAFIDNARVHYTDVGGLFGRGVARDENAKYIFDLAGHSRNYSEEVQDLSKLSEIIREVIQNLGGAGIVPNCIITTLDHSDIDSLDSAGDFTRSWGRDQIPGFVGMFNMRKDWSIPIYAPFIEMENDKLKGIVCITEINKAGEAIYYSPAINLSDRPFCNKQFLIKVVDLNEDNAERIRILQANPPWLAEHTDKEGYLRGRVVVKIAERLKIDLSSAKNAGYVIRFSPRNRKSSGS